MPNNDVMPQRLSQFTPKMKVNTQSHLLSSLVRIDHYNIYKYDQALRHHSIVWHLFEGKHPDLTRSRHHIGDMYHWSLVSSSNTELFVQYIIFPLKKSLYLRQKIGRFILRGSLNRCLLKMTEVTIIATFFLFLGNLLL